MHELSIARHIVEIVSENVSDRRLVRSVTIRVGEQAGVVPESLEFCYSAITSDGPLAGSSLRICRVPFKVECTSCGSMSEKPVVRCPMCGARKIEVRSGTELDVVEMEIADQPLEVS